MTGPTHLCLVSDQPLANLLPALDPAHRAARVVLAVSPEMRARAAAQERVLRRGGGGITVETLQLPSAYDLEGIRDCIAGWLLAQAPVNGRAAGQPVMLNATGGTKPMAMAAQDAFLRRNLPVFYLQADTGQVHFLSSSQPPFQAAAQLDLAQLSAPAAAAQAHTGRRWWNWWTRSSAPGCSTWRTTCQSARTSPS